MFEYAFVSVRLTRTREGAVSVSDYRDVIRDRDAAGWEFVQAIPLDTDAQLRIDLVFRRKGAMT